MFGGNAYVNKTLPGSPRIAVNNFKIFEFGEFGSDCSIRVFKLFIIFHECVQYSGQ